jgi:tetratricopeptide (TPR) repeat protein
VVAINAYSKSEGPTLQMVITERAKRSIRNRHQKDHRIVQSIRRGNTLSRQGQLAKSIKEYELAISYEQGQAWAHNRRGHVFRLFGDLNLALQEHEAALSHFSEDAFAYCGIAAVNYQRGWFEEAVEYYGKALKVKPDYINALNGLGKTLCRKREFAEAEKLFIDALGTAIQIEADTPWLHLHLSISQLSQGGSKFKDAAQNLTEALKQFSRKERHFDKDQLNWGTHTFYQYSMALVLANSPQYEIILDKAIGFCSARGLKDEIIADLETISSASWDQWAAYSRQQTSSDVILVVRPETLIAHLERLR